jgi:hypothetical protein
VRSTLADTAEDLIRILKLSAARNDETRDPKPVKARAMFHGFLCTALAA